ncbi:MAG: AzlC family ABC transporter permease [Porcipelethomonas sp.]
MKSEFLKGIYHGLPIALGYFSVSFGFGIMAVKSGLSILTAVIISGTNLTSAGQAAAIGIIASGGAILEMVLTQFIINIRYSLMSLSLSQKLDSSFSLPKRLIVSFGITDEIFAVAASRQRRLTPAYMYGLILPPAVSWIMGTFFGAWAGEILPASIASAMGILLYGMFIAIIIPPARKEKSVLIVAAIAAAMSCIFRYVLPSVSGGFAVIISAVAASLVGALFFPAARKEES